LAAGFLAMAFFFAGTPRTLCAFTAKTNFATQIHCNFLPDYSRNSMQLPALSLRPAGVRLSPL
jgi:hypothetical protein